MNGPSLVHARSGGAVLPRSLDRSYPRAVRAAGIYVEDASGKRYLDGSSGALVVNIGYGRTEVGAEYARQAAEVPFAHTSQFTTDAQERLAERLVERSAGSLPYVVFASGGSEAVETAIKLARQYHVETGSPGRSRFIARWSSYHGATLGALAASGHTARRRPFDPLLPSSFTHIAGPSCYRDAHVDQASCAAASADELETEISRHGPDSIAAFIAEPVGGAASGAAAAPLGYHRRVRDICDRYGILFIADEVMCGAGRTGSWSALETEGVTPDLLVLGKGLASGYAPLAAVLVSERVYDAIRQGSRRVMHGYTYSGHAPSCAAGLKVLDILDREGLVERAGSAGAALRTRLDQIRTVHSTVGDVRGAGLLLGIEFVQDRVTKQPFAPSHQFAARVAHEAFARGLIVYPGSGALDGLRGDHILVGPPFISTDDELDELTELLSAAIGAAESPR